MHTKMSDFAGRLERNVSSSLKGKTNPAKGIKTKAGGSTRADSRRAKIKVFEAKNWSKGWRSGRIGGITTPGASRTLSSTATSISAAKEDSVAGDAQLGPKRRRKQDQICEALKMCEARCGAGGHLRLQVWQNLPQPGVPTSA